MGIRLNHILDEYPGSAEAFRQGPISLWCSPPTWWTSKLPAIMIKSASRRDITSSRFAGSIMVILNILSLHCLPDSDRFLLYIPYVYIQTLPWFSSFVPLNISTDPVWGTLFLHIFHQGELYSGRQSGLGISLFIFIVISRITGCGIYIQTFLANSNPGFLCLRPRNMGPLTWMIIFSIWRR